MWRSLKGWVSRLTRKQSDTDGHFLSAVRDGNYLMVQVYARDGANVNVADDQGWTALHYAALGHVDIVKYLLDLGANPNARAHPMVLLDGADENDPRTPLSFAANKGHAHVVALLQRYTASSSRSR